MNEKRIRIICALIIGLLLSSFGVFIFSDFQFRGKSLEWVFHFLIEENRFGTKLETFFELFGSGFFIDLFAIFSKENFAESSFIAIFFGADYFPVVLTWFSVGLIIGCITKSIKLSYIISGIVIASIIILWFTVGMFSNADLASMFAAHGFLNVLSGIVNAMVLLAIGALLGGLIGGPNYYS